jgi:hypothetical protein
MSQIHRRTFVIHAAAACAAAASTLATAQAVKVEETDPQAMAMGFRRDTTKVDAAKYPSHTAQQRCAQCQMYMGKPDDAFGPCSLFGGKLVAPGGWCSVYTKKA